MNKLYFAKYLPVEGEIKEGYLTMDGIKGKFLREEFLPHEEGKRIIFELPDGRIFNRPSKDSRKAKLFLCSRDIQVGDKIRVPTLMLESEWTVVKDANSIKKSDDVMLAEVKQRALKDSKNSPFKVIGEISPEAVWVKEGDEFDENEIKIIKVYNNCAGDLELLGGDGEDGEDMEEPLFMRCLKCNSAMHYSERQARKGCKMLIHSYNICLIKCPTCKKFH